MNSNTISVPNPKRTAIFDFLDSEQSNEGGYPFDSSSPPLSGRANQVSQDGPSAISLLIGSEEMHERFNNSGRLHDETNKWESHDILGARNVSRQDISGLPPVPSLSSLASPWEPQPTSMHLDVGLDPNSRAKSGFGGVITSTVGLDLQWSLYGSAEAAVVPLPGSRATSALGSILPDVPLNTPQPISRPVSTKPISEAMNMASISSLLGNDGNFPRTITPPSALSGSRSISPRLNTINAGEDSRWPKPVRFSLNPSHTHRSTLLDTPNYPSNQQLDGLLQTAPSTTPTIVRPTSTSLFSPDPLQIGGLNGSFLASSVDLRTRSGRDSIGSPFPSSQNLIVTQNELPLEALEQYRQSREPTPQIPSFHNNHSNHSHYGSNHHTRSPPPYANNHFHNHQSHHPGYSSRSPGPNTQSQTQATHHPNYNSNQAKSGFSSLDDRAIENVIVNNCYQILLDAAEHMLKAVELANTLRARVGTEVLAQVRERWGGLLSLLEKHKERFLVERIPKNDRIRLLDGSSSATSAATDDASNRPDAITDGDKEGSNKENNESRKISGDSVGRSSFDAENELHTDGANNGITANNHPNSHTASRCLHVGNVPNTYTDAQLTKEFERFGVIEGLKLINQKNGQRRFAFITFETVEQAIMARHALSKVHPWKSAISFAHKDLLRQGHAHSLSSNQSQQPHQSLNVIHGQHSLHGNTNPYQAQQQQQQYRNQSTSHQYNRLHSNTVKSQHSNQVNGHRLYGDSSAASYSLPRRSPPIPVMMRVGFDSIPIANTPSFQGGIEATTGQTRERIILQRLCDDTYVPTQPWPVDREADMTVGQNIIDQIAQFGGSTTISKLRGFLKHRMGTVDNIKSVPLKAMLLAYPQYFHVDGNYVSLVSNKEGGEYIPSEADRVVSATVDMLIVADGEDSLENS